MSGLDPKYAHYITLFSNNTTPNAVSPVVLRERFHRHAFQINAPSGTSVTIQTSLADVPAANDWSPVAPAVNGTGMIFIDGPLRWVRAVRDASSNSVTVRAAGF